MVLHQLSEEQLRDRLLEKTARSGIDPRAASAFVEIFSALLRPATAFIAMMEEKRNEGFADQESLVAFLGSARDVCYEIKALADESAGVWDDLLIELQATFLEYPDRPAGAAWKYEGFLSNNSVGAWIVERLNEAGISSAALDESMINVNLVNVSNGCYELLAAVENLLSRDHVDSPGLYEGFLSLRMRLDEMIQTCMEGIPSVDGGTFPGLFFGIGRIFEILNVTEDSGDDHQYLA